MVVLAMPKVAVAYSFSAVAPSGQTLYYNIVDGNAQVTYEYYSSDNHYYSEYTKPTGSLIIPSSVICNGITYSVTSIGVAAFYGCNGLTSVTIPNTIAVIGPQAFLGCSGLSSVTIPNSVTSIGYYAFRGCSGLTTAVYNSSLFAFLPPSYIGSYSIPDGITSICDYAFADCCGLTSVTIPNSITSIGHYAFDGCSGLTTVNFNAYNCIEAGDESNRVFPYCNNLSTINFGNSVTTIPSYLCYNLTGLTTLTIPNSVTSIGDRAFYGCIGLTTVNFNAQNCTTAGSSNYYGAFYNCPNISVFHFGNNVTNIPDNLCCGCTNLSSVMLPNSITAIGSYAFSDCRGISAIAIPNSVTTISDNTFSGCINLISVTIPNSVTSIGYSAFSSCSSLASIVLPNSVTSIGDAAFASCSSLASVTVPNSVNSIGNRAFYNCGRLTAVYFNAIRCTYTNGPAFQSCPNFTTIIFGDSVSTIPPSIFANCIGLTTLDFPNSVEQIGNGSFRGCDHITNITLGTGVTTIKDEAFSGCTQMVRIISKSVNPPTAYVNTFNGLSDDVILDVPCDAANAYENAAYWFRFNIQEELVYDFSATSSNPERGTVTIVTEATCNYREAQVQANAYHGYHFDHWSDGNTDNPRYIVVLQDTHLVAYFASDNGEDEGIEETEEERIKLYQRGGRIVVEGAEGYPVYLYDVVGRLLATKRETAQEVLLDVPASGAYLVKIGDAPARRIVVRR